MNSIDVEAMRQVAEATAVQAGRLLVARRQAWATAESSNEHDVKLTGDRGAEAIAAALLTRASGIGVYSEEAGYIGGRSGEFTWVLDPLDGSANYLRGVPLCCVSIALCRNNEPVLGVIHDFSRNETFSGLVGMGAWLNDADMRVSSISNASEATLATGFPAALDHDSEQLAAYINDVRSFRKVRSLGTAALMLAYVASGRMDVYREHAVRFWDVAAGMALVLAAGGKIDVTLSSAGFDAKLDLIAWNGKVPV